MARTARLVRSPATLWRTGPFGTVLLAPGDAEPQALDATAAVVWAALAEPASAIELARDLAVAFDADESIVAADLAPLLDAWLASGAVEER
ncbi:MAG: PqqD family protein [Actinomycetes bacterium]